MVFLGRTPDGSVILPLQAGLLTRILLAYAMRQFRVKDLRLYRRRW